MALLKCDYSIWWPCTKKGFIRSIIKIIHGWCGKTTHSVKEIGQQKFEKEGQAIQGCL